MTSSEQLLTAAQGFINCNARSVRELVTWHRHELAHDVSANEVQRMHVPVRADYSAVNHVIRDTLRHVSSVQHRIEFLEHVSAVMSRNSFVPRVLARIQWSHALFTRAQSALALALLRSPLDAALWLEYLPFLTSFYIHILSQYIHKHISCSQALPRTNLHPQCGTHCPAAVTCH